MAKKKYDWKKTAEKAGWAFGEVFVAGLISIYANQPWFLMLVPLAEAARNWIKHRKN